LVGFYDKDEVVEAKQTLFRSVNEFDPKVSDSPRLKTRSKAPNKRRLDCEDVMGLLVFLDKRQLMDNLPKFYAADLNRVPRIAPTEVDSVRLVKTVGNLREQLCTLTAQFQELTGVHDRCQDGWQLECDDDRPHPGSCCVNRQTHNY